MISRYLLFAELPLILLAAFGAFAARLDPGFLADRADFTIYLLAALLIKPVVFWLCGMYRRYWPSASIADLGSVVLGVVVSIAVMAVFVWAARDWLLMPLPAVIVLNDGVFTLCTAVAIRLWLRAAHDARAPRQRRRRTDPARRILIVGAGAAGTMVASEMRRTPSLRMEAVGFLDDDPAKVGRSIAGLPVLGSLGALSEAVRGRAISDVFIAMPSAKGARVRELVAACDAAGVRSQSIPGVSELLDGKATISRLRNVDIADLLRRSPAGANQNSAAFVSGRVVLITGGGGSIGYELARQVANASPGILALIGHGENSLFDAAARLRQTFPAIRIETIVADIRDVARLAVVFDRVRPAIVFHAAAHKHVPLMEENAEDAVTNNVFGTLNVVGQAIRSGAERFVLISTDKAVEPTSVMGATKRIAELIVRRAAQDSGRAFASVRFGNVLGSRGSVVHTFKQQIEQGGPITITDPAMTRFFMTIPEAVHLVLVASGLGRGGEVFVLDMGEPVRIVQLAEDMIKLSGGDKDLPIVFTGARIGEKIHETLVDAGMATLPTSHPDVLQVTGDDPLTLERLDDLLERLRLAAERGDRAGIEAALARVFPTFAAVHGAAAGNITQ